MLILSPQIELERTKEDIQIDEICHYVMLLERHMGKVAKQSELLVRSSRESARAMHELGQGLLGKIVSILPIYRIASVFREIDRRGSMRGEFVFGQYLVSLHLAK